MTWRRPPAVVGARPVLAAPVDPVNTTFSFGTPKRNVSPSEIAVEQYLRSGGEELLVGTLQDELDRVISTQLA
jgi:hypothetical protein